MYYRPVTRHRLLALARPPATIARQMAHSVEKEEGRHVFAEHLHVTLDHLGDFQDFPELTAACLAGFGATLAADPVQIILDRMVGSGRSVSLRPQHKNAALHALQREVARVPASVGCRLNTDYGFNPHLTLFYRDGQPFTRMIEPFTWTIDEVLLVHSLVGQTRHRVLGRWRLSGAARTQLSLF